MDTHLKEANFWIVQEFRPTDAYTNEERNQQKRDAVYQAQTHALISIAESLEALAQNDRSQDMIRELADIRARMA